jgi:hypothetical protein
VPSIDPELYLGNGPGTGVDVLAETHDNWGIRDYPPGANSPMSLHLWNGSIPPLDIVKKVLIKSMGSDTILGQCDVHYYQL